MSTTPTPPPDPEIPFLEDGSPVTHPEAMENFLAAVERARTNYEPPPDITVSEWARRNRVLPKGTTSRPGAFIPEKFQVEMMDAIIDPNVHEVVVLKSTQIGYSDAVLNNIVGYFIDIDPKPMMLVQPTIDNAKDYGKKRITPMIRNCEALKGKVRESKSRDGGNTLALKEFPNGFLKLSGANAGTGLRSDPLPIVLFDEVDGYPLDVDGEGDPIEIGTRRTDGYSDWKIVKGSTPAKPKGFSRIEKDFARSDQRHFNVPCPFCSKEFVLYWKDPKSKEYRLLYEVDADDQVIKSTVRYICPHCRKGIPERYKKQMLDNGRWIASFPGRDVVGFFINALYSPWRENWHELAKEWHDATKKKDQEKLKAFINLRLAETWEEAGDSLEEGSLKSKREDYPDGCDVPNGVGILVASVDTQGDRLECVVKGFGAGEESWLIAYQTFFGDPGKEDVWEELDEFLQTEFRHQSGRRVRISVAFVDSGGHHTESVYKFAKTRQTRRIFAIRGSSESGQPILAKASTSNSYKVKLWTIGTDTAKDRIFSRLRIPLPSTGRTPGYIHLPKWADDEYLDQLTSEKRITVYKKGRGVVSEYKKTRARNEALDLEVYALAALYSLGQQKLRELGELADELAIPIEGDDPGGGEPDPGDQGGSGQASGGGNYPGWGSGGGGGWVNGWK